MKGMKIVTMSAPKALRRLATSVGWPFSQVRASVVPVDGGWAPVIGTIPTRL